LVKTFSRRLDMEGEEAVLSEMIMQAAIAGGLRRAAALEAPALARRLNARADDYSAGATALASIVATVRAAADVR
jgi:hypothetical protein